MPKVYARRTHVEVYLTVGNVTKAKEAKFLATLPPTMRCKLPMPRSRPNRLFVSYSTPNPKLTIQAVYRRLETLWARNPNLWGSIPQRYSERLLWPILETRQKDNFPHDDFHQWMIELRSTIALYLFTYTMLPTAPILAVCRKLVTFEPSILRAHYRVLLIMVGRNHCAIFEDQALLYCLWESLISN